MKHIIHCLTLIRIRYYIAAGIIISAIAATPGAVELAYRERGYKAIGGEYLIIPLGIIAAMMLCRWAQNLEDAAEERRKRKCRVTVVRQTYLHTDRNW